MGQMRVNLLGEGFSPLVVLTPLPAPEGLLRVLGVADLLGRPLPRPRCLSCGRDRSCGFFAPEGLACLARAAMPLSRPAGGAGAQGMPLRGTGPLGTPLSVDFCCCC